MPCRFSYRNVSRLILLKVFNAAQEKETCKQRGEHIQSLDGPFWSVSTPSFAKKGHWKTLVEIYEIDTIPSISDLRSVHDVVKKT